MASTRIQQAQLVLSLPFQQQVMGSLLALCSFIITTEAAGVANHANRLIYANAILTNPLAIAGFVAPGLISQAAILADAGNTAAGASGTVVPDADCDAAVLAVFNFFANQWVAQFSSGAPLQIH
jgi:hypothetical protein